MPAIPTAYYPCHDCCEGSSFEPFHPADRLRLIGGVWLCEDCYYDALAQQGHTTFMKGRSYSSYSTLSALLRRMVKTKRSQVRDLR